MKREELEVGVTITRAGWTDRVILFIGKATYFYAASDEENRDSFACLGHWEVKTEKPELRYIWRYQKEDGDIIIEKLYLTEKEAAAFTLEHVKCTEFKPITKDGKYYEGE